MSKLYTKEEVADRLGKKTRTVEEYQKDGFLKPTSVPNPKGRAFTRYTEEAVRDLEKHLAERDAEPQIEVAPTFAERSAGGVAEPSANTSAEPIANSTAGTGLAVPELPVFTSQTNVTLVSLTEDRFKQLGTNAVPLKDKLILTLDEAHQLSGLSVEQLRKAAISGQMKAEKLGRGWKVRPKALEVYCEALVPSE